MATYSVPSEATFRFMWSSAMPSSTLSAEAEAGTSSADQAPCAAPSTWYLKPNRCVLWLDQKIPILPGIATTAEMSSVVRPVATVVAGPQLVYGAALERAWILL